MSRTKISGDQGETCAAQYLEQRGCTILERQWRCRYGELDIVARSPEGILCFVEVKRRNRASIGLPREFVDSRKQERLRKTAAIYLSTHNPDAFARFDVAEVYEESNGELRVEYLENAFA